MNVNLNLDRRCDQCFEDESDHPIYKHFLYYENDKNKKEEVWDTFDTKKEADDVLDLLVLNHGVSKTYNEYKFRYSYEECNGVYK